MMIIRILIFLFSFVGTCYGHGLQHEVTNSRAVVVKCYFSDGERFAYESYEVYPPEAKTPTQTGRTDSQGRLIFLPDKPGKWSIKVSADDGHGLNLSVAIGEDAVVSDAQKPLPVRFPRIIAGLGYVFGIIGLLSLFYRKKRKNNTPKED
jgi:nickel transport protein